MCKNILQSANHLMLLFFIMDTTVAFDLKKYFLFKVSQVMRLTSLLVRS